MQDLQLPESRLKICQICQKPFIKFKEETSNSINYMFVKSKVAQAKHGSPVIKININK